MDFPKFDAPAKKKEHSSMFPHAEIGRNEAKKVKVFGAGYLKAIV